LAAGAGFRDHFRGRQGAVLSRFRKSATGGNKNKILLFIKCLQSLHVVICCATAGKRLKAPSSYQRVRAKPTFAFGLPIRQQRRTNHTKNDRFSFSFRIRRLAEGTLPEDANFGLETRDMIRKSARRLSRQDHDRTKTWNAMAFRGKAIPLSYREFDVRVPACANLLCESQIQNHTGNRYLLVSFPNFAKEAVAP
jgi:hypothetical protein